MENLNDLEALAASTDAQANEATALAAPVDPDAPPPPPSHAEQAADMVETFVNITSQFDESIRNIWPQEVKQGCAAAIEPLLIKYNISFTNIPPELVAAFVIGPPLWATSKVLLAKVEKMKAAAQPKRPPPPNNPAETPEMPVHPQMGLYT